MIIDFFKEHEKTKTPFFGLILNELNHLNKDMIAYMFELIDSKKIEDYILPSNTFIIATSNHINDSEINNRLLAPLSNRFTTFELEQNVKDFIKHAEEENYHKSIINFIKLHPQYISSKQQHYYNEVNFPSPRNWYKINKIIYSLKQTSKSQHDFIKKIFYSTLGKTVGDLYFDFIERKDIYFIANKHIGLYYDENKTIPLCDLYIFDNVVEPSEKTIK